MTFAQQADLARKAESVINSCTRKKHLPAAQKYAKLALKRVDMGNELWHTLNSAISRKEQAINDKPRYRLVNGEWRKDKSKQPIEIDFAKNRAEQEMAMYHHVMGMNRPASGYYGQMNAGNPLGQLGAGAFELQCGRRY